ncbi:MAG: hypothetical protein LBU06_02845 [Desulfovibrio sp.]|nr:hypothetical protein [Desulfovibrio sp.]
MKFKGWKDLLLAFVLALALWYGVTGSEKLESQVEVRVDYRGLPHGLIVREGFVNRVSVRLRASAGMLRSISGRDYAFNMDLSDVRKGDNVLAINANNLPFHGGVEVMDISPSRIYLKVEGIDSKKIPVEAKIQDAVPDGRQVFVSITPPEVTVSGASSVLQTLNSIELPLHIGDSPAPGVSESKKILPVPGGVDVSPIEVGVAISVNVKLGQTALTLPVEVQAADAHVAFVQPDKIKVVVSAPENMKEALKKVKALVLAGNLPPGRHLASVQLVLPPGVEAQEPDPSRVSLDISLKNAPPEDVSGKGPSPGKSPTEAGSAKKSPGKTSPVAKAAPNASAKKDGASSGKNRPSKAPAGKKPGTR